MVSLIDLLSYSLRSLSHRKLRSYLTVLGIVIGVAAVVCLISISDGLMAGVEEQLEAFGPRNAVIMAGDMSSMAMSGGGYAPPSKGKIFEKDMERVKTIPGTTYVTKQLAVSTSMEFKKKNLTVSVYGTEPEKFSKLVDIGVYKGRYLTEYDRGVAVIGEQYADDSIFKSQHMDVGSVFYLGEEKKRFRVVGILDPANAVAKSVIIIPYADAEKLAGDSIAENEVTMVRFQVAEGFDFDETIGRVEWALASSRGVSIDDKDFSIMTSDSILEQVGQIIGILTAFLGFITAISLLVGGVGVANTMYMAVMEKTKEIGTLKAIGASSKDVLLLIVLESAIIGLVGGIIGLLIGWVLSIIVSFFDFKTVISPWLIAFALIFSIGIGVISGILPARKASKLSPIVAIRQG
ncbi:MAG: ABC transporter permease [Candidatus Micrarchaeota archaeon]